ncbi:hypothetical protein ACQ3G7_12495 [Kosakonia oryzendophytica]|uniref:hypothetical protein n=1 Tax=Kosakonia oryzendophytica TaxID=1005665 RepID=UPI003D358239
MSKIVVVLGPGGTSEFLTVADGETSIPWALEGLNGGATSGAMPIETYYCEGEEFYFARIENMLHSEVMSAPLN